MIKHLTIFMLMFSLILVSGCSDDDDNTITPPTEITTDQVMDSLSRYQDIAVALQDGYTGDLFFVTDSATGGSMGLHFMNPTIEGVDPFKPQVLLYGVSESGQYELAAVEWFVPSEGLDEAPTLFGQTFHGPMEGHGPGQPEHYDLHAWLFTENPDGMFEEYNTDLTPPGFMAELTGAQMNILGLYSDVQSAEVAGYVSTIECVEDENGAGGMGVHYVNEFILDNHPDRPNILLFEPQEDSSFVLVGAEWFAIAEMVSQAPILFGQTFNGPMPGHGPEDPEHYDLHVWLGRTNPAGIFADFNPTVGCPE